MPGACLMTSTSGAVEAARHLAVGAAPHHQRAVGRSRPRIAAENPAAIDSTDTNTIDDARDADDGHRRGAEPRWDRAAG